MLTKNTLTPELQIERWEDRRDIKNLMGLLFLPSVPPGPHI